VEVLCTCAFPAPHDYFTRESAQPAAVVLTGAIGLCCELRKGFVGAARLYHLGAVEVDCTTESKGIFLWIVVDLWEYVFVYLGKEYGKPICDHSPGSGIKNSSAQRLGFGIVARSELAMIFWRRPDLGRKSRIVE
jgi:hypothetical protein